MLCLLVSCSSAQVGPSGADTMPVPVDALVESEAPLIDDEPEEEPLVAPVVQHALDHDQRWASRLRSGDRVVIEWESRGCFHAASAALVLTDKEVTRTDAATASVPMTESDLEEFDRWLAHLRSGNVGLCTTSERVVLTWISRDETVLAEKFDDDTCTTDYATRLLSRFGATL